MSASEQKRSVFFIRGNVPLIFSKCIAISQWWKPRQRLKSLSNKPYLERLHKMGQNKQLNIAFMVMTQMGDVNLEE